VSQNRTRQWTDNVVRENEFLARHDGATIEHLEPAGQFPYWRYRAVVPGSEPVESADLGDLLDQLEA
jgi:hypothetical protein